ncbi:hypothetical protein PAAG_07723 [Paracoccidioides lutzii Pb01]|uniref:Uncharacterized protein n=1 Tax=Paracoccidioides lutzii (strain ATCC MYA-826 / Pb01) TaxID=502779 RepID=C1H9Z4_PARBA|nr:hypothetical protein PAAG_07723 [Paracoccidioides lutzii Pb01]EEH37167.2 hypothetical protein PAAG_07723 [Paracoccidioides lutzii Pb01]
MQVSRRPGGMSTDGLSELEVSTITATRHWEDVSLQGRRVEVCEGGKAKDATGGRVRSDGEVQDTEVPIVI